MTPVTVLARHLYSTSSLDQEIVACFLIEEITGLAPLKMQILDIVHLVSRHDAQNDSTKPLMWNFVKGLNSNLCYKVLLR